MVYRIQRSQRAKPKVVHSDTLKPHLGPPIESWLSVRAPSPSREPQVLQSVVAPKQLVVDDGVTQSLNDEEPSIHHSDAGSEISVGEVEGGEGDNWREQADVLEDVEAIAECGAAEPRGDVGANIPFKLDPLPETVVEEVQRGQGKRKVKAPERFGEWVSTMKANKVYLRRAKRTFMPLLFEIKLERGFN